MNVSRRTLLRMMGLAGASYFLPSLGGKSAARADGPAIPRRIVFFYTEQGTLKPLWAPSVGNAPDPLTITQPWSSSDHVLGELHQPLVSYRDRLLFLDNIDMISSIADPTGAANGHINGETHALVAANRMTDQLAGGPSIDQFIASGLSASGTLTSLPSLEVGIQENGFDLGGEAHPLYSAPGQPIPLVGSPAAIYDRIFPNGPKGTTPEAKAALAKMIGEQQTVLNHAKNEFASLGSRVGRVDRERLTAHAAAVSDLSRRLALGANAACAEPDRTIVAGTGFAQYELNADVMMRLVQTALACDLTRVATLYVGVPPDELFGYHSVQGTSGSHDLVHKTNGVNAALANDPEAMAIMKRFHTYHASMFAKFLGLLDAIPEPDGGTLLDHTLVVWCGQLAGGDHSLDHVPYVLGGRMGGAVKTGRYVRYPRTPDKDLWPTYSRGPAHNDLFVALANMMGVATSTFGNAAVCKGALGGLS